MQHIVVSEKFTCPKCLKPTMGAAVSILDLVVCTDCFYGKYEKELAPILKKMILDYFQDERSNRIVLDHDILEDLDPMIESGEVERVPGGFIRKKEPKLTFRAPDLEKMSDSTKKKYAMAKKIIEDSWTF